MSNEKPEPKSSHALDCNCESCLDKLDELDEMWTEFDRKEWEAANHKTECDCELCFLYLHKN